MTTIKDILTDMAISIGEKYHLSEGKLTTDEVKEIIDETVGEIRHILDRTLGEA